jgi:hypothetical protein
MPVLLISGVSFISSCLLSAFCTINLVYGVDSLQPVISRTLNSVGQFPIISYLFHRMKSYLPRRNIDTKFSFINPFIKLQAHRCVVCSVSFNLFKGEGSPYWANVNPLLFKILS